MAFVDVPQETMDIEDFVKADKNQLAKTLNKDNQKIVITQNNKELFWFTNKAKLTSVVARTLQDKDILEIDKALGDGKETATAEELGSFDLTQAQRTLLKIKNKFIFFMNLDNEEVLNVTKNVKFMRMKRGEVIFEQNSEGKEVYFVIKGRVEISIRGKKNEGTAQEHIKKIPLAVLNPEQIFGEMAPITGEARSAQATSILDDTTLLSLNIADEITDDNMKSMAKLLQNFVHVLSDKLVTMNQMVFKNR